MPMHRNCGPKTANDPPRARAARAFKSARRMALPFAALCVVAGLAAGCGGASTPLEKYQNCLKCGYNFSQPIPTAGLKPAHHPNRGLAAFGRDDLS